ncbi:MAG: hypothetical protein MRZ59_03695 [Clostridiales bacterium]|nr:hypothetical protein [Clostridiales bacterium]MDY3746443.1 hypothetical protein [Lachnospiraceae bacterium]
MEEKYTIQFTATKKLYKKLFMECFFYHDNSLNAAIFTSVIILCYALFGFRVTSSLLYEKKFFMATLLIIIFIAYSIAFILNIFKICSVYQKIILFLNKNYGANTDQLSTPITIIIDNTHLQFKTKTAEKIYNFDQNTLGFFSTKHGIFIIFGIQCNSNKPIVSTILSIPLNSEDNTNIKSLLNRIIPELSVKEASIYVRHTIKQKKTIYIK